jgi:NADH-quinone oxidoreductase subunit L
VGAWHAALFHLATHACFKALMFLGAGSVIHGCHHEQDMRRLGGLWRKMPVTGTTFLVGVLAISGLPWLSGFYSKDAILAGAWNGAMPALFWVGLLGAVLTAFYMMRLFVMTFLGDPGDEAIHEHAHEGGFSMKMPLIVLAALSVVAGGVFGWGLWHETLLAPDTKVVVAGEFTVMDIHREHDTTTVAPLAIAAGIGGLVLGWVVFSALSAARLAALKRPFLPLERACAGKLFFDELWQAVLLQPAYAFARLCGRVDLHGVDGVVNAVGRAGLRLARASGWNDDSVVDGAVRGVGVTALVGGGVFSRLQSGRVRFYLSVSVGVVAAVLVFVLLQRGS